MNRKPCSIILAIVIILFGIVGFSVFVVASSSYSKTLQEKCDTGNVDIQWYYIDDDVAKPITLPNNIGTQANKTYTIKGSLPSNCDRINTLVFRSSQQAVEIRIDDELIYSYNTDSFRPFGKANPSKWNVVNLPNDIANKTISVSVTSPFASFSGDFNLIKIGNGTDLISDIVKSRLYHFVTSCVVLLAGIFMFISSFFFLKDNIANKKIRYISICAFFAASWMMSESKMISIPINDFATYQLAFLSLKMLAIALSLFLIIECPAKFKKYGCCILGISIVNLFVTSILHVLNICDFMETNVITSVILFLEVVIYVVNFICQMKKDINKKYIHIEFVGVVILVISFLLEMILFYANRFNNTGTFCNIGILIFILLLYASSMLDLINKANLSTKYEAQLKEAKNYLMLSQMKPHFIYNTLGAIRTMIISSPQTAYDMVTYFSKYLRANINTIDPKEQILFSKELEHIKSYVEIEKIRFVDRIHVEYSIERDDFFVPPLTIQPLVENAIKHGICKKIEGGHLKISSFESSNNYIVTIEDDGVGFDPDQLNSKEKEESVGLNNIQFRLREIAQAQIKIESVLNKGTKVTVFFNKEGI